MRELTHATHPVAAHLALGAVRIEHTHIAVRYLRGAKKNYSVAAYAEVSVGKAYCHRFGVGELFLHTVEIDIVVAYTVHFVKFHK